MPTGVKPVPRPGWLRIDFHQGYGPARILNTLWLSYDATEAEAADDTDFDTIEPLIRNDWLTRVAPHQSTDLELREIRLVLFRASGELALPYTTSVGGGLGGDTLPANVSAVVNWDVHAFYRGGKPKVFISGITYPSIGTVTELDLTYASSLATSMNAWLANVHTYVSTHLTVPPVPIAPSFVSGGAYRAVAVQRQIYRAWVQPRLCTQRRRLGPPVN